MMKNATLILFIALNLNALSAWVEKSNFGGEARHRCTSFTIGDDGYMGLGHINGAGVDIIYQDFWKYDPASDSWSQIANYPQGPCFHATSFVIGNKAYVGTGRITTGSYSKKFYSYDPTLNLWSPIADLLGVERRGAVSFTANGKGYVGTGQTMSGYSTDFYEYSPTANSWAVKANFPGAPRTSSVAFSIQNIGYVGTGNSNSGSTNDFYAYLPSTNQWVLKASVGPIPRQEAVGFAVNGYGYIGTGDDYSSGNNYGDMWEYSPGTNSWVQVEDFAGTARRYLTAFVIGSRAYCGTGTNGTNFRDLWMYDKNLSTESLLIESVKVSVYPNPSVDQVSFDLNQISKSIDKNKIEVLLFTLNGQLTVNKHFEKESLSIDISNYPEGNYLYQMKFEGNTFKTGKLTVSRI